MDRTRLALRFGLALGVLSLFAWWSWSVVQETSATRVERAVVLERIQALQSAQLVVMTTGPFEPRTEQALARLEATASEVEQHDERLASAGRQLVQAVQDLRVAIPEPDADRRTESRSEMIRATDRLIAALWAHEADLELQIEYQWLRVEALAWCGVALGLLALLLWGLALKRGTQSEALALELASALRRSTTASQAKSDFIAVVSHEIRTPLTAMLGSAELLEQTSLDARQVDHVRVIRSGGDSLLHIVSDVLDMSRIEAGKLTFLDEPFDVEALLDGVVLLFWERAHEKGVALSVCATPRVPTQVMGDGSRIRQVLVNLVSNAVKFTDEGAVRVDCDYRDGRLILTCTDTGPGVPVQARDRIFEAFTQAEMGSRREYGGTGLGLAISARLVAHMGGELSLTVPEVGSVFVVTLPLPVVVAPTPIPPDAVVVQPGSRPELLVQLEAWGVPLADEAEVVFNRNSFHGPVRPGAVRRRLEHRERTGVRNLAPVQGRPSALVVDDNEASRTVVAEMLGALGCRVRQAEGGAQAVEAADGAEFRVIFMDCDMPGIDGLEATRRILAQRPATVIGLSGHATPEFREQALQAGMVDYLTKPVRLADLRRALDGLGAQES